MCEPLQGRVCGNFVLLRAAGLRLLLPQQDVGEAAWLAAPPEPTEVPGVFREATAAGDDPRADADAHAAGPGTRRHVALSADWTLHAHYPAGRRLAVPLAGMPDLWWCWDEVQVLIGIELAVLPLPPAVLTRGVVLRSHAELQGQPAFFSTASQVLDLAPAPALTPPAAQAGTAAAGEGACLASEGSHDARPS